MKFSISLHTPNGDRYLVCVSPLVEQLRRELELPEENIEVCQIVLDRERGDNATDINILSQITDFVAKVLLANDNIILYYVCDDINEIPNCNHNIPSQEYRSRLFSSMFDRYVRNHNITDIINVPVIIKDAIGNKQYVHIISDQKHDVSVKVIVDFVIEGFAVGK